MNVLLVDDHPLYRVGFAHALVQAQAGIAVRTAATVDEGLAAACAWPELDLVLIDYHLANTNTNTDTDTDGLAGLGHFGRRFPLVARVLMSGQEDPALAARAREAGASGFIGKSMHKDDLVRALHRVAEGGEYFAVAQVQPGTAAACGPTARQMEVLALLAHGLQNKHIAAVLGIAERTVKLHVTALLDALQASNRTHLLVRARERGLL